MKQELLDMANQLSHAIYQTDKELAWLTDWSKNFKNCTDETFLQELRDRKGNVFLQREIPRRDVERAIKKHIRFLRAKKAELEIQFLEI